MKKLMLGMAVATGLVVVMAGQSSAADLTSCDMSQAILEAEAAIKAVGGKYSTQGGMVVLDDSAIVLSDAKGVSLREHVKYLEARLKIAREAVISGYVEYPEELYATVTEGTRALKLITGVAKTEAKQTAAPKATTNTAMTVAARTTEVAATQAEPAGVSVKVTVKPAEETPVVKVTQKTSQVQLAVAKIEKVSSGAKLASLDVTSDVRASSLNAGMDVAAPEETAGLDQEMKVPATGTVDTGELEKILMTIGVASAAGMLGLAGICALIGRR